MSKFWGLTVNVGKKFKQQVEESFCISSAAVEPIASDTAIQLFLQQEQTDFLLCTLSPKQGVFQVPLNVRIGRKETIGFLLKGGSIKSKVHLTGFTLPRNEAPVPAVPFKGLQKSILVTEPKSEAKQKKRVSIQETEAYGEVEMESSDDEAQPGALCELRKKIYNGGTHDDEDDDLDDDDEDSDSDSALGDDEINELKQLFQKGKYNPKTGGKLPEEDESDLELLDDDDEEEGDEESEDDDSEELGVNSKQNPKATSTPEIKSIEDSTNSTPRQQCKNDNKKERKGERNLKAVSQTLKTPENKTLNLKTQSAGHTPMKTFTKGGVLVNDIRIGIGQVAKLGKMVTVYYVGRLKQNNKKFDASEGGPGFRFRLGKGEVIRGWDLGVEGMKVGGKRKLVIPAQLAYGKRGAPPDIPPNATLIFEVELKNVS
ncbi:unnamed protein product [Orchesella dallaii]|uniref:FK506-binding protein n=1 Tax=Orchesella dallaii TaxID=48710 RepID=A0ABP1S9Y5_9HEXA